jgi:hypothetical protein
MPRRNKMTVFAYSGSCNRVGGAVCKKTVQAVEVVEAVQGALPLLKEESIMAHNQAQKF